MRIGEQNYQFCRGSDIVRDGMYLEVTQSVDGKVIQIAEVFFSDITAEFTLSCFIEDVPLKLIEELIRRARKLLPPA
ncbi:hypothetical protein ABEI22_04440 [Erwinia billingiae]|uniref:hypothetical protein n=1 Tax=Erwinia billingiae TaxID=182337 RepID=UPI003207C778